MKTELSMLTLGGVVLLGSAAHAGWPCTAMPPPSGLDETGDVLIMSKMNQSQAQQFVNDLSMPASEWRRGGGTDWWHQNQWATFGWDVWSDTNFPMARTLNALWALKNSGPPASIDPLNWLNVSYGMAASWIDELMPQCYGGENGTAFARTYWGPFINNLTMVFDSFFHELYVPERAGTILHEARHAGGSVWGGKQHGDNCCTRGVSCDWSWEYDGANTYQVNFLADYWFTARPDVSTFTMRNQAKVRANLILEEGFCTDPGFRVM